MSLDTLTEEIISERAVILRKGEIALQKIVAYLEGKQNLTAEDKRDLHNMMKPVLLSVLLGFFELARFELSEIAVDTIFLQEDKNSITQIINAEITN